MDINYTLLCSKCKKHQPPLNFRATGNKSNGREKDGSFYFYYCRSCEKLQHQINQRRRKEKDYLHYIYIAGVKERNKKYSGVLVSFDELDKLWEQQCGLCYWSKIPMIRFLGRRDALSVSIDRIDNQIGYVQGNCVLCCQFINVARQVQSPDEFRIYLKNFLDFITPLVCIQESRHP